ncbi:MAG: thioredoxin-disulfide reductase [Thermodesulfobacteriota bacterium]
MYDLIIIGGGPGGLCAGIYAQRSRLKTVMLERELVGGQIARSDVIENYPGFPSISGMGLMEKFEEHARGLDLDIKMAEVRSVTLDGNTKVVKTTEGDMTAKAVIVASGAKPRMLGVPGEKELFGRGVSYCATCDGPFFRDQEVMVVGGGDTAVKESLFLTKMVKKLYLVHRRDQFRAEKMHQEKAEASDRIEFLRSHLLKEIKGDATGVVFATVHDLKTEKTREIAIQGIFIFVGIDPITGFIDVEKDERGFIKTNGRMETSMPGVYAVGDCRTTPLLQVATAVGDGAIAAFMADKFVEDFSEGKG